MAVLECSQCTAQPSLSLGFAPLSQHCTQSFLCSACSWKAMLGHSLFLSLSLPPSVLSRLFLCISSNRYTSSLSPICTFPYNFIFLICSFGRAVIELYQPWCLRRLKRLGRNEEIKQYLLRNVSIQIYDLLPDFLANQSIVFSSRKDICEISWSVSEEKTDLSKLSKRDCKEVLCDSLTLISWNVDSFCILLSYFHLLFSPAFLFFTDRCLFTLRWNPAKKSELSFVFTTWRRIFNHLFFSPRQLF